MRIQVLPPSVAERIAAGEVIERPASVVKELVENSIDAGAQEISVVLEDGGRQLIEITDNGHGMGAEDLELSVRRHATSKLRNLDDLERILTLGFRGEALASVAAVSAFRILSREKGADTTYELRDWRANRISFGHFLGSPHGTRVEARGLFSQVPARLKFLKSQASEVAQAREWVERVALAHPATTFKLESGGRVILALRSEDGPARVQSILSLSDDELRPLVQARSEGGGFKILLYWLQGLSLPSSRRMLQVVNGRSVRDRLLQQATMSAFRQALLPGQFPAVALFVDIDPALIDVNVHPTKTELRFINSREIFRSIESLVEASLIKHGAPSYAVSNFSAAEPTLSASAPMSDPSTLSPWNFTEEPSHPLSRATFVGTLFGTYFLFDDREELILVDQHAAHERIRYEKLRNRVIGDERGQSQALLVPEAVKFPPEHRAKLELRLALLADLGFETEIFGEDRLLVRSIPAEWGAHASGPRLQGLLERLIALEDAAPAAAGSRELLWDEGLFEKLASEACHSAIRAGDRLDTYQGREIVSQLFTCQHPWNCPHGRPTVVRLPRGKLEEWFQRRV